MHTVPVLLAVVALEEALVHSIPRQHSVTKG
jgi:hypothetical protein